MFEELKDLIKDVGDVVKESVGTWRDIMTDGDDDKPNEPPQPQRHPPGSYDANITLGDFKFTPDWRWVAVGAGALILAKVLSK